MNSRGRIQYKPVPPSGGAGTLTVTSTLVTVPPCTTLIKGTSESPGHLEEQDACAMENYMGENGLAAEEEYKWGHYTCGEYELSPTPPCARVAPHEFHAASTAFSMYPRSL